MFLFSSIKKTLSTIVESISSFLPRIVPQTSIEDSNKLLQQSRKLLEETREKAETARQDLELKQKTFEEETKYLAAKTLEAQEKVSEFKSLLQKKEEETALKLKEAAELFGQKERDLEKVIREKTIQVEDKQRDIKQFLIEKEALIRKLNEVENQLIKRSSDLENTKNQLDLAKTRTLEIRANAERQARLAIHNDNQNKAHLYTAKVAIETLEKTKEVANYCSQAFPEEITPTAIVETIVSSDPGKIKPESLILDISNKKRIETLKQPLSQPKKASFPPIASRTTSS